MKNISAVLKKVPALLIFVIACAAFVALYMATKEPVVRVPQAANDVLVTLPVRFVVNANPTKVWGELTKVENFCALAGFKATPRMIKRIGWFHMIGDHISVTRGAETGRLFVTKFEPNRELRVKFESDTGELLSSKRVILRRNKNGGTFVELWGNSSCQGPQVRQHIKDSRHATTLNVREFFELMKV